MQELASQLQQDDSNSWLSWLNQVFKKYPEHTLVLKNTLGEQDAEMIMNRVVRDNLGARTISVPPVTLFPVTRTERFIYCLKYGNYSFLPNRYIVCML